MWAELVLKNRDHSLYELDYLIESLNKYRSAIENNDLPTLTSLLEEGKKRKEEVDG
jgi:prephenate dehydrogenase